MAHAAVGSESQFVSVGTQGRGHFKYPSDLHHTALVVGHPLQGHSSWPRPDSAACTHHAGVHPVSAGYTGMGTLQPPESCCRACVSGGRALVNIHRAGLLQQPTGRCGTPYTSAMSASGDCRIGVTLCRQCTKTQAICLCQSLQATQKWSNSSGLEGEAFTAPKRHTPGFGLQWYHTAAACVDGRGHYMN
jgi:hypothetical protein